MPPKGRPNGPKAAAVLVVQLTCFCLFFAHGAASQPLPEVAVPGINPFFASPPRKKPGPPQPNPFLANGAATTVPVPALPAAEPAPEQQQPFPCSCTTTGMSGAVNTSTIGCGQWLVASGSNVFICYIAVSP
jgi:hypothetical protein